MRLGDRATLLTVLTVVAVIVVTNRCTPAPSKLPEKVQAAVTRHEIASAVDTAMTNRLEREKDIAHDREIAAAAARFVAERAAAADRRRADSLAIIAANAQSARDSADAWHDAYDARSTEADSLRATVKHTSDQLEASTSQLASADSIANTWRTHALRGDSLLTMVIPLAGSDQCRILYIVACPSRRQATLGGVIVGTITTIVVSRR